MLTENGVTLFWGQTKTYTINGSIGTGRGGRGSYQSCTSFIVMLSYPSLPTLDVEREGLGNHPALTNSTLTCSYRLHFSIFVILFSIQYWGPMYRTCVKSTSVNGKSELANEAKQITKVFILSKAYLASRAAVLSSSPLGTFRCFCSPIHIYTASLRPRTCTVVYTT